MKHLFSWKFPNVIKTLCFTSMKNGLDRMLETRQTDRGERACDEDQRLLARSGRHSGEDGLRIDSFDWSGVRQATTRCITRGAEVARYRVASKDHRTKSKPRCTCVPMVPRRSALCIGEWRERAYLGTQCQPQKGAERMMEISEA